MAHSKLVLTGLETSATKKEKREGVLCRKKREGGVLCPHNDVETLRGGGCKTPHSVFLHKKPSSLPLEVWGSPHSAMAWA